jgi:tyrosinase
MGPDYSLTYTPHCLRRDFSAYMANLTLTQDLIDWSLEADSFGEYDRRVQAMNLTQAGITSHGGGHFAVGGMVGEVCLRNLRISSLRQPR